MGTSSGLGEVLRYAQLPFFGSKLAGQMCNFPNIVVTPASSSAVAGRGDGARALVTEVTGSDVTQSLFIGHCVTCANRNWNTHRLIASDIHRVTFESPHPGRRVQAFGKSNPTSSFLHRP